MGWEKTGLNNKKEKQRIFTQTDVGSNVSVVSTGYVPLGKSLTPMNFYSLPVKWAQYCLTHRNVAGKGDSRDEA